jgi:hypothetical protein
VEGQHTNFRVNFEIERIGGRRGSICVDLKCKKPPSDLCGLYSFIVETHEDLMKLQKSCDEFEEKAAQHLTTCIAHTCLH